VVVEHDCVTLLQLNLEALTKVKINVFTHHAQAHAVTAIGLQETHYKHRSHQPSDHQTVN